MSDISETTNMPFYSGSWQDIANICKSLQIGDGLLSVVSQEVINDFQEMVDREIDAQLNDVYWTPLKFVNQYMPNGETKSLYPGNIVKIARHWVVGLLIQSQFQGHEPNTQDSGMNYVEDAKKELYDIVKFQRRLFGQEFKSSIRTMPPTMQPPFITENNV